MIVRYFKQLDHAVVYKMEEIENRNTCTENRTWSASPESECDKHDDARKRKKHRRGRRRKYKPYETLTAEERRELEQKEAARAARKEAEMVGKPDAPWNTTQFIMEDHGQFEVRIPEPRTNRTMSIDSVSLSSEDFYESPEEADQDQGHALEQDFETMYHQIAAERLQGLSKDELVKEYFELENEMETVQSQIKQECTSKISELEEQLLSLKAENSKLAKENEQLKSHAGMVQCQ